MPTRNNIKSEQNREPDALIKDRNVFKAELIERITIGKDIISPMTWDHGEYHRRIKEYETWNDYNSEWLKHSFNNDTNAYRTAYNLVNSVRISVVGALDRPDLRQNITKFTSEVQRKIDNLERLLGKADLLKSNFEELKPPMIPASNEDIDLDTVFIVHGHDEAIKLNVARTLEKLGLKPVILHEQANSGKTVIEKFEHHSNVGFAIILLTSDDLGKAKAELDYKERARQNVILELGYFMGKLTRQKVLALYTTGVELPSDILGLGYTHIDAAGHWRYEMVRELRAAGYNVDANKLF